MTARRKIILVAESGADIPDEAADRYGIFIVSMYVTMNGMVRKDGSFPVKELDAYYRLTGDLPQTSAPNPQDYREVFLYVHDRWPDAEILHLCYSAVTSCSYQNAVIGSEDLTYVTHIDSKNVSAGQALLVLRTAEYLEENPETTMDELVTQIKKWVKNSCMVFVPGNLEYLRAGGRVSNAAYLGASILSLRPLIEIQDGKLVSTKKYRGKMAKVILEVIEGFFREHRLDTRKVTVLFSDGFDHGMDEEIERILKNRGVKGIIWSETGTVITTHCGPGAFGLAAFAEETLK